MLYKDFTPEQFAADEFFIRWIKAPDHETETFWNDYISHNPEQIEVIDEARELVRLVQISENLPSEQQIGRIRDNVYKRIGRKENVMAAYQQKPIQTQVAWYRNWQRIAAVFIGLLLFTALAWYGLNELNTVKYQTAYGQMQNIRLPDGSQIMLNGNSTLSYKRFWNAQEGREVWLDGEAFFQVKHFKDRRRFQVHTSDRLVVEVLGTSFNVSKRKSGIRVALQSGKVKLTIGKDKQPNEVVMKPGEEVALHSEPGKYTKKQINPQSVSAWTKQKLVFDDTPLAEIVTILEETYGLRVQVSNAELLEKRVVGSAPTGDVHIFLAALSKSFGLNIQKEGNHIIISSQ